MDGSKRVALADSQLSVDSLLDVVNDLKRLARIPREAHWASVSRLCAASGWAEGLRALALERSIRYRADELGAGLGHWGAWSADLESCLIALEMEPSACATDALGMTPMHWAGIAEAGPPLCHALLKAGADPAALDRFGLLAAHWSNSEAFWAWTMSALWAKGRRLAQLPSPMGIGHEQTALALGHAQAARWIRWELGASCVRPATDTGWTQEARRAAARIESRLDLDLGVAKSLGLGFDWR